MTTLIRNILWHLCPNKNHVLEREWLPKFKNPVPSQKKNFTLTDKPKNAQNKQQKALGSIKSEGLKNMLDNL